jgi:hypothetical protein
MTDEVQALAEVDSAQAPEVTATTDNAQNAPVVAENQDGNAQEEKKYSQAEIDAMIGKRLAREQRKWEREQQAKQAPVPAMPTDIPTSDQFDSPQAYGDFIRAEAEKLVQHREIQNQRAEIEETFAEREEEARSKYDDFDQVAYNPNLRVTDAMAETIKASDLGPDLAYWLGSNPKEADRISRLSPLAQAKEIGKIEAKLSNDPPVKRTTSAPAPISPVTARSSGAPSHDTTDPRSIKSMTTSQWIEAERARQIKKQQAQYR